MEAFSTLIFRHCMERRWKVCEIFPANIFCSFDFVGAYLMANNVRFLTSLITLEIAHALMTAVLSVVLLMSFISFSDWSTMVSVNFFWVYNDTYP